MKIPKDTMTRWEGLKMTGDANRIVASMSDENRVHPEVIRVAMRTGEFRNLEVFKAVCAFYNGREVELAEAMQSTLGKKKEDGVHVTDLNVATNGVKNLTKEPPKTNYSIKSGSNTFLEKRRNQKSGVK